MYRHWSKGRDRLSKEKFAQQKQETILASATPTTPALSKSSTGGKNRLARLAAIVFWIGVWQLASMAIGREVLLASPWRVCTTLARLAASPDFWAVIAVSFGRIVLGFFLAVCGGVALAVCAAASRLLRTLFAPLMLLVRAVPVASFIILVLLWVGSRGLSVVISFLMVLPVVYANTLQGIDGTDGQLLEMARIFHLRWDRRLWAIYLPAVLPHFSVACSLGMGLAFKSGIAAEVIGLPDGSIGERLYQAKIYLSTGEVLAWTAVIVLLSVLLERLVRAGLRALQRGLGA